MTKDKKNIIFVMSNMNCGGAEKSLISLLQTIDYNKYNVDLQLFKNEGLFLKQVHKNVNILPPIDSYKYFDMPISMAIMDCIKKLRFDIIFYRSLAAYIFKTEKNTSRSEQRIWKYLKKCMPKNKKHYDAAFGFLEKMPVYYCIDKLNANRKIGFIHNDYEKLEMDPVIDRPYFKKLDAIVTDSEECKAVLLKNFPETESKFKIIANIVSPTLIHKLSSEIVDDFPKGFNIISIGRFDPQKGYDFAIDALKIVKEKGITFHWTILGEGGLKSALVAQIKNNHLEDDITFLGIKENHYPYVKKADLFMQTSRFEGKSIAIDEAKILNKPILVTNFSTVNDQISNNKTGIIVAMNPEAIATGIIALIENTDLRKQLSENLSKENLGTEREIEKIYQLV
jgi:glycosyltransferase involved in cell wall biosynthesis